MENKDTSTEKKYINAKSGHHHHLLAKPKIVWDTDWAKDNDVVKMIANIVGFPDGTQASFTVYEYDADGNHDLIQTGISSIVKKGRIEAEWKFQYTEDTDDVVEYEDFEKEYTLPEFIFEVKLEDKIFHSRNLLRYCGGPFFVDEESAPLDDIMVLAILHDERIVPCEIIKGYLTNPYLWQRGKVQFHLIRENIGGIE